MRFAAVSPRPLIFISAVSRELKSARQIVANTLTFLGYQPVWQEIFGTESGDLRAILRQQIGFDDEFNQEEALIYAATVIEQLLERHLYAPEPLPAMDA